MTDSASDTATRLEHTRRVMNTIRAARCTVAQLEEFAPSFAAHFDDEDLGQAPPNDCDDDTLARRVARLATSVCFEVRLGAVYDEQRDAIVIFNNNPLGDFDRRELEASIAELLAVHGLTVAAHGSAGGELEDGREAGGRYTRTMVLRGAALATKVGLVAATAFAAAHAWAPGAHFGEIDATLGRLASGVTKRIRGTTSTKAN